MNLIPEINLKPLVDSLPGLYLVLLPDFTIAAASDRYLQDAMTNRDELIGHDLFNIFPPDASGREARVVAGLKSALNKVLQFARPLNMAVQKYAIRNAGGGFAERYWSLQITPVFNEAHELVFITLKVDDVSGMHKPSEKLKRSEKDYQLLVDSVTDYGIFMIDTNGGVFSWNSGAERIKGYTASEIIGKPFDVFYTAEDLKRKVPLNNLQKAAQYGHYEAEGWRVKKDGSLFWANTVITALKDDQGRLYGYSKITRDITEAKNAQQQLESLSRQINQSNDAIFTTDINRKVMSWNQGAKKLYGFATEEVLGKDVNELLSTAMKEEDIQAALNSIAEQGYWTGEIQRKTKTGNKICVQSSTTAIRDDGGDIAGYVGVSFDITEQKRLRQQVTHLANIVEQSSEAIISWGIDRRFISWNKGAEKLFGYSKKEAIGKTPLDLRITLLTQQEIAQVSQQLIEKANCNSEMEFVHKNGSSFYGTVSAYTVNNDAGETASQVFIIRDISLRKQLDDQLKKHNAELEEKIQERTKEIKRSEEKYLQLFENNPLPIWVMDTETTRFIAVNEMAIKHYGYSREEFLNMSALDIRPPEDRERFRNLDRSGGAAETQHNKGIWRHYKKDGSIIYVEIIAHQIMYDGVPARIILANDVTERKITEDKLTASENRFRALIENSHDIISLMDESFKIIYRSPAAARLTGWANEDMIAADATKNIHPDDQSLASAIVKEVLANPGKTIKAKFRMRHQAGHYLWVEGILTNLLQDEYVKAVVFNFRDVTKRIQADEKLKMSEKQFRSTLDNLLEGVQIIGFDWRYIYVNDAMAMQGKCRKEALLGYTVMEIFPGIEQTEIFKAYQRCFTERESVQIEHEFEYRDKSRAWFEMSFQPVPEGIFILSVDITERRKAEQALREEQGKFSNIVAISPGLIYSFKMTPVGHMSFVFASDAFEGIFGVPYKTVADDVGIIINAAHQLDRELLISSINESATNMSLWQLQFRYYHPAKGIVWLQGNSIPGKETDGSIIWHGVIADVTERKIMEDKINEQNLRLKSLSDNIPGMMFYQLTGDTFDSRKFSYVSNGVTELTGKTPDEILKDPSALYNLITAEDVPGMMMAETESYNKMTPFNVEVRCRDFKGKLHWVNIISTPRRLNNDQVVWDGLHLDITEKKKAEEELKRSFNEKKALAKRLSIILNALPANIALLDGHGNIVDVNDAWRNFARHNRYTGSDYFVGDNYIDIAERSIGPEAEDGKRVARGIKAVLKKRSKEFVFEYPCDCAEIKRWYRMIVTPLQEKEHAGVVVMHIDISELRRLEEERLRFEMEEQKKITKAMLLGQEKERNHIGQELHDNINQILAGTKMFLGIAGNKNKEVKELIKYPMELLDSSMQEIRTLCHKMVTPLKNVDLEVLIRDLLGKFEQAAKIKTRFIFAVAGGIISDELQLNIYRIIQELVNNIHKYAAAKNVSIRLNAADGFINICVTDDGIGFDPEKKRNGVGISNMINRVSSFNGTVSIKSAEGHGCITYINLPF